MSQNAYVTKEIRLLRLYVLQSVIQGKNRVCILLYYAGKSVATLPHSGKAFPYVIQKYTKFEKFTGLYFPYFTIFRNQT